MCKCRRGAVVVAISGLLLPFAWLAHAAQGAPAPQALLWYQGAKLTQPAVALLQAMEDAADWGLDSRDYGAAGILSDSRAADSPQRREAVDRALSGAALRFILHLHEGRVDPHKAGFDVPPRPLAFDAPSLLAKLAETSDTRGTLAAAEPPFQHYALLKAQLAVYRRLAGEPGLTRLPAVRGRPLAAADRYTGAPALRALLVAIGDLPAAQQAADTDLTLDPPLIQALQRFQFRHGLKQDGVIGRQTYAALTTPLAHRVWQIELTLERWRWLPALNAPTVIVNVPQFRLFAFDAASDRESQMLTMNVIVGQPYRRTPTFAADMKFLIFRPYWDVPYSIMSGEMLPGIRARRDYLAAHNFEIVGADGTVTQDPTAQQIAALAAGRLRVRQRPGAENALGLVKFMFPNRYDVYLHGTPAQALFAQSRRTFSHGCIRVSDPVALAEYVLRHSGNDWPRGWIEAAMQGTETLRVPLSQWISVRVVYGTAVASEAGRIYFFDDVYGNDARLAQLLKR